jgi:hypothetical protein
MNLWFCDVFLAKSNCSKKKNFTQHESLCNKLGWLGFGSNEAYLVEMRNTSKDKIALGSKKVSYIVIEMNEVCIGKYRVSGL